MGSLVRTPPATQTAGSPWGMGRGELRVAPATVETLVSRPHPTPALSTGSDPLAILESLSGRQKALGPPLVPSPLP